MSFKLEIKCLWLGFHKVVLNKFVNTMTYQRRVQSFFIYAFIMSCLSPVVDPCCLTCCDRSMRRMQSQQRRTRRHHWSGSARPIRVAARWPSLMPTVLVTFWRTSPCHLQTLFVSQVYQVMLWQSLLSNCLISQLKWMSEWATEQVKVLVNRRSIESVI